MADTANASPIKRQSVVDDLAEQLRARILHGDLEGGTALRQEALASTYGVSRMPVREALRQLEAEGLVVFQPHRGVVVSALSSDEAEEMFDLRLLIEPDLVQRAVPSASKTDIAQAEAALKRSNDAYEDGEVDRWGALNWAFHTALYQPANRPRTLAFLETLSGNVDRYIRLQLSLTTSARAKASDEHRQLLDLFKAGDAAGTAALLRTHIDSVRTAVLNAMQKRQDPA